MVTLHFDVILTVFNYLPLGDLLRCTHVSILWRSAGMRHPTYWKDLSLSDQDLTTGGVALFISRLNAQHSPNAAIWLTLGCATIPDDLATLLLSQLCNHIHRAEKISLGLSARVSMRFAPLFQIRAPLLRDLCFYIRTYDAHLEEFPSLFGIHLQHSLEKLTLVDVPLQAGLPQVSHNVQSVAVFYFDYPPLCRHLLTWIPRAERLSISSPRCAVPFQTFPAVGCLQNLALRCVNWFQTFRSLAPAGALPSLVIEDPEPSALEAIATLPDSPALCICIKKQHTLISDENPAEWGVVAVTTPDRSVSRVFHNINSDYMVSESFMDQFIPSGRLVTLVLSISHGFAEMCSRGHCFPRLETLCIGVSVLPKAPVAWDWGAIECPRLRTLAFQAELYGHTPFVSTCQVQSLIDGALIRRRSSRLRIVLKDVAITGTWESLNSHSIASVIHVLPRQHWLHDTGVRWTGETAISTEWMDMD